MRVQVVSLLLLFPMCSLAWLTDKVEHHCGVDHVHSLEAALDQARMHRLLFGSSSHRRHLQKLTCDELCEGCIQIDTVFHLMMLNFRGTPVIPHPTSVVQRWDAGDDASLTVNSFTSPAAMIQILRDQVAVTNQALQGSPFRLNFVEDAITFTDNDNYMRYPMDYTLDLSRDIGSGDLSVLDIFLSYTVLRESERDNPPLRVGTTFLPSQQLLRKSDGLFVRYDTLTGGGLAGFDLGVTVTHELGHWLGLYHTFRTNDGSEFGCESYPNDFIDDTPAHLGDSMVFDCREFLSSNFIPSPLPDTCPNLPGLDPVFNFMNYVSLDECHIEQGEFTCNQVERMYYQWVFYRDEVSSCPPGEMELEFAYEFDREHDEQNRVFVYETLPNGSRGPIIFDSNVDHDDGAFLLQDIMAVDICLPSDRAYEFVITDSSGDGFSAGGVVAVYQNGVLIASTTGNFGSTYTVIVPAVVASIPTEAPTAAPTPSPTLAPTQQEVMRTEAPTTVNAGRTNAPTENNEVVETTIPTARPPTASPRLPTQAPHPLQMMKSKKSNPMKSLENRIRLRKMKSKKSTKASKSMKMPTSKGNKGNGKGTTTGRTSAPQAPIGLWTR